VLPAGASPRSRPPARRRLRHRLRAQACCSQRFPDRTRYRSRFLTGHAALRSPPPAGRAVGDLEHLPLTSQSIDLYWSSLAVQWCDLPKALAEAHRVLSSSGQLAIASLGPHTFHELRHAFSEVDAHQHTLGFHTPEEIGHFAQAAGFVAVDVKNSLKIAHYADFKTLLKAVKAIGANQIGDGRRTSLMSRAVFMRAEAAFETLRTPAGLPLTYDVVTLTAQP
jgi:malonyl-CoA O-methyltransferase